MNWLRMSKLLIELVTKGHLPKVSTTGKTIPDCKIPITVYRTQNLGVTTVLKYPPEIKKVPDGLIIFLKILHGMSIIRIPNGKIGQREDFT